MVDEMDFSKIGNFGGFTLSKNIKIPIVERLSTKIKT